jgi:hypothetical protein
MRKRDCMNSVQVHNFGSRYHCLLSYNYVRSRYLHGTNDMLTCETSWRFCGDDFMFETDLRKTAGEKTNMLDELPAQRPS